MKFKIFAFLFFLSAFSVFAGEKIPYKSKPFYWEKTAAEVKNYGENRQFEKCTTNNVDYLEVHATTLNPGKKVPSRDVQSKFEKLLIVKEGKIWHSINGVAKELNNGSATLVMAGDKVTIKNLGDVPAVYYMIQWQNPEYKKLHVKDGKKKSELILWDNVPFTKSEKGGGKKFFRQPTDNLFEFEMHVTMLKEGLKSHDPHVHPDDEIILIKSGTVEENIDGQSYQLGPGSFVLLNGGDPHGLKNIGNGSCEYFAFRFLRTKIKK